MTDPVASGEFTCALCGGTFPKGWSDEEAAAESRALWGEIDGDDKAVICDDCFQPFMSWADDEGLANA